MSKVTAVLVAVLSCALIAPLLALADDSAPARDSIWVGASYSSLGDFGNNYGARAMWNRGNWLVTGGWNNIDATVPSLGGPMNVDGSLWTLDVSYIWWLMNPDPEESPTRPDYYFGLGVGAHNIDATWTLVVNPSGPADAKKVEPSGHVVVGARWPHIFVDLRYAMTNSFFGYKDDGLQLTVGAAWSIGE